MIDNIIKKKLINMLYYGEWRCVKNSNLLVPSETDMNEKIVYYNPYLGNVVVSVLGELLGVLFSSLPKTKAKELAKDLYNSLLAQEKDFFLFCINRAKGGG